MGNRR